MTIAPDKPRFSMFPWEAIPEVAALFDRGARTHGSDDPRSWATCDKDYSEALYRHFVAWACGEVRDEEGNRHLAAIAANALIMIARQAIVERADAHARDAWCVSCGEKLAPYDPREECDRCGADEA